MKSQYFSPPVTTEELMLNLSSGYKATKACCKWRCTSIRFRNFHSIKL